mgnify:CR=1 FL=1|jgi:adenylyl-sulfate kinase|tara:strand:- start:52 stop:555 length:504 start_codon:yes stop_codon:yes gene_type:complete
MIKTLWLTGLPCSGKTSISIDLNKKILSSCVRLDGDELRNGLCSDLDFTHESRLENVRRVAHISKLLMHQEIIPIVSILSPLQHHRDVAKDIIGENMVIIYLDTDLETCEQRDVKGMYAKARKGIISNFTGISDSFESPTKPDLVLKTSELSIDECSSIIIDKFVSS